jgi:hypothetical protein
MNEEDSKAQEKEDTWIEFEMFESWNVSSSFSKTVSSFTTKLQHDAERSLWLVYYQKPEIGKILHIPIKSPILRPSL